MANDISIDDMIAARQQAQPGFKKADFKKSPTIVIDDTITDNGDALLSAGRKTFRDGYSHGGGTPNEMMAAAEKHFSPVIGEGKVVSADHRPRSTVIVEDKNGAAVVGDTADPAAEDEEVKASDPEGKKETPSEDDITKDEVDKADTPEGKEDVRVGTEEAAAAKDKAKAIEALGKAKDDEERAEETIAEGPETVGEYEDGISEDEIQSKLVRPDIDGQIARRQIADAEPAQQGFKVISIDGNEAVCETVNGVRFKVPVW